MTENKFIDIEKVLEAKAPKLKKWMPRFILNWLKRKLHEDDINKIMHQLKDVHGLEFNNQGLEKLGAKIISIDSHNIPPTGGVIMAANHPLGGLDGMALVKTIGAVRSDVHFVVNDMLKNLKNYGDIFIGINKVKNTSATSLRNIETVLSRNEVIAFFPAGLVSRKTKGVLRDLEWKKSFVTQAIERNHQIVPVFIDGENSRFFYRFANFRKRLGIKTNIEMFFLADEMFKQRGQTVKVRFGAPFSPALLNTTRSHKEWAGQIKNYVYSKEFQKKISFEEYLKLQDPVS